jgi:rhodanese-related sulfurtransferase
MRNIHAFVGLTSGIAVLAVAVLLGAQAEQVKTIQQVVLGEANQVLDARPYLEYAVSHIPGARNVAAKPGVPMSMYVSDVAEISRLLKGERAGPIVLYCNGPFCGKSKRLAEELLGAGFTNVKRYQLGIPVWRALGGVCEIDLTGLRYVLAQDRTGCAQHPTQSGTRREGRGGG